MCRGTGNHGIYDDHDFGQNNGDASYPGKRKFLFEFLGEDSSSEKKPPRRGLYR